MNEDKSQAQYTVFLSYLIGILDNMLSSLYGDKTCCRQS